ncbi:unnamed protein product [Microthlaspi erraticum]|uniref:DUF4220 domain-containing protein n=1 Tax=Microthlaspi erraticum TaxID=1685480 RepID=A0A6D2IA14_9BRAS|nr:unnamed protein product [Microthlaspi erraticum]
MGEAIPKEVKDLWDRWNIRGLVILTNWAAEYRGADLGEPRRRTTTQEQRSISFWATFLLLHLGGPDTITALALEDNDLWLRSLFGLVCQAIITIYVFLLSIPNNLLVPTSLMLVAGVIKYVERIKALRVRILKLQASMLREPDPGPDYARIEESEKGKKPEVFVRPNTRLTDLEVVQYAYKYFNIFKGLVVDLIFSSQSDQWNSSKEFLLLSKPEEALRVLEVELSFIYGTFYTKVDILHTRIGVAFRFLALASLISSLCIFTTRKKNDYSSFDVGLTYALLIGGIALDFVAIFIFCVSDWTFARFTKPKEDVEDTDTRLDAVINLILGFRKLKWKDCNCSNKKGICQVLDRKFIFRRWSEHIYAYNLIGYSLGIKPEKIHKTKGCIQGFFQASIRSLYIDHTIQKINSCFRTMKQNTDHGRRQLISVLYCLLYPFKLFGNFWFEIQMVNYVLDLFGISDQLNEMIYTSRDRITREMWEFVYKEIKERSDIADGAESDSRVYSGRGEWVLRKIIIEKAKNSAENLNLLHSVTLVDYDQSILMWHIATELLYQTKEGTEENHSKRQFSKTLSDYLMYLLVLQPALMSTVAGIDKMRFLEAIADAKKFTDGKKFFKKNDIDKSRNAKLACEQILSSFSELKETKGKRYQRRNVLTDASKLAKTLNQLNGEGGGEEVMWEVVSRVWVEMLCYAATHCDPKQHVAQLSRGGEFISFVWILMAHFGLGVQFQTTEGNGRAKLIVVK